MNRFLVILFCAMPSIAFVCIDPGTGGQVVQALFAPIVVSLANIRHPLKALYARPEGLSVCTWLQHLDNLGPVLGWRNAEGEPTLQRARRRICIVLCLGLIHRLLVMLRTPLMNLMDLFADLALVPGWTFEERRPGSSNDHLLYALRWGTP